MSDTRKRNMQRMLTPQCTDGTDFQRCGRVACTNAVRYDTAVELAVLTSVLYCSTSCAYTDFYLRHGQCTALQAVRAQLLQRYGRTPQLLADEQPYADVVVATDAPMQDSG